MGLSEKKTPQILMRSHHVPLFYSFDRGYTVYPIFRETQVCLQLRISNLIQSVAMRCTSNPLKASWIYATHIWKLGITEKSRNI